MATARTKTLTKHDLEIIESVRRATGLSREEAFELMMSDENLDDPVEAAPADLELLVGKDDREDHR